MWDKKSTRMCPCNGGGFGGSVPSVKTTSLHDRLLLAAGHLTYAKLGAMTGVHPETVRRFMQGQTPKPEFLAELCLELGLNGDWLLTGRGQMWSGGKGAKSAARAAAAAPEPRAGRRTTKKAGKKAGKKTGKKAGKKAAKKAGKKTAKKSKKRAGRRG